MEVSILSSSGMPANAHVSVGVRTRRVVRPCDSGKTCAFAEEKLQEPGVLKLDVLSVVGSTRVLRQPGPGSYSVTVPADESSGLVEPMMLEIGISGSTGTEPSAPEHKKPDSHREICQQYLEEHKLTEYLQAMVKTLLDVRPSDPYAWMSEQLLSKRPAGDGGPVARVAAPVEKSEPAPVKPSFVEAPAFADLAPGKGPESIVRRLPTICGGACVVTGPSGVGKSTLIKKLMAEFPGKFGFSVSHTTRGPRPGETDGVDYHFVSRASIERDIEAGLFIEHAEVHGNYYGTSTASVQSVIDEGKICLLDIDVQGAESVRQSSLASKTSFAFFAPPSLNVLEERLRGRGTETEEKVQKRLQGSLREMAIYTEKPDAWDLTLSWYNEDVEAAYHALRDFLKPKMFPAPAFAELARGTGPEAIVRRSPSASSGGACVVTGPSGVGKSTLIKKLMAEFPGKFGFSVSHTTRGPRPGETDGVDYHFVSRDTIERDIAAGLFIENAEVHGNYYGTSTASVQSVIDEGKICLLDIDVQGAESVRKSSLAGKTSFAFFAPPSMQVLEQRLRGRGTETEEKVQKRLKGSLREMAIYVENPDVWDLTLSWYNEDVEAAYAALRAFLAPAKLEPVLAPPATSGAHVTTTSRLWGPTQISLGCGPSLVFI